MSVKDRLDRLEEITGGATCLPSHSEMLHDLQMKMEQSEASLILTSNGLFERIASNADKIEELETKVNELAEENKEDEWARAKIMWVKSKAESNADDINTLEARAQFNNGERRILEGRIDTLNSDINTLKEALPDVEDKINALEARTEELENAEADIRWNAPATTSKGMKFIKIKNTHCDIYLLRFNDLAIKSCWDEEEDQQIPGEIIFNTSSTCIVKTYSDKEAWQHHLNLIEWFTYDDSPLLDLTDLVAPKCSANHHDICPKCGEHLYYCTKPHAGLGPSEAAQFCIKCNYKES